MVGKSKPTIFGVTLKVGCVVLFTSWFHRWIGLMWALMRRTFNRWTE